MCVCVCVCHKQWSTAVCSPQSGVASPESWTVASFQPFTCAMSIKHLRRVSRRVPRDMPRLWSPAPWTLVGGPCHLVFRIVAMWLLLLFRLFSDFHLMTQWTDANAAKLIGKTQGQHCVCLMDSYSRAISVFCSLSGPDRYRFGNLENICSEWLPFS